MKNTDKPQIVPTLLSLKNALWSGILIGLFLACLALYSGYGRIVTACSKLCTPDITPVNADYFVTFVPAGWENYEVIKEGDVRTLVMHKSAKSQVPFVIYTAERRRDYAYRALDLNRSLALKQLADRLGALNLPDVGEAEVRCNGDEVAPVKPGIVSHRMLFGYGPYSGSAVFYYVGDIRFLIFGLACSDDEAAVEEIRRRVIKVSRTDILPDIPESFERPVLDAGSIDAETFETERLKAEREIALWKLFASRADSEPDASLLPAIEHFRKALHHLAILRQERTLLESDDYARFRELVRRRREIVKNWFVMLDKCRSIGDLKGAKAQAKFIIAHATLVDESLDARRAKAAYAELNTEEEEN